MTACYIFYGKGKGQGGRHGRAGRAGQGRGRAGQGGRAARQGRVGQGGQGSWPKVTNTHGGLHSGLRPQAPISGMLIGEFYIKLGRGRAIDNKQCNDLSRVGGFA